MKLLALLLSLAGCVDANAAPGPAFQSRCDAALARAAPALSARQSGYSVDNSLSYKTLMSMKAADAAHPIVLGLTKAEARVSVGFDGVILPDAASAYECAAPTFKVAMYYEPIVVYVAREFAPGSCAYAEVLAHERRHLNVYLSHLPKAEAVVRAALARRFREGMLYAPAGQMSARIEHEIDATWMPFVKDEMGKAEDEQARIDTFEESERMSKVCAGEVQSIIKPPTPRSRSHSGTSGQVMNSWTQ
ncbi:MAG: hypothetical protein V4582_12045 [Pseudomonadota bacterium]